MSTRMVASIVILVSLVGCGSAYRTSSAPVALDERLTEIAQVRLASAAPTVERGPMALSAAPRSRPYTRACGTDQQMGPMTHPAEAGAPSEPQGWFLTEFDDQPAGGQGAKTELGLSADQTEREDKYLHKQPMDSMWETIKRDVKDMPHDLWHDTKRVYGNLVNLVILGTSYAGCLALQETGPDDTVEDHYKPGHHTMSEGWRNAFDAYGNPGTHFAVAGVLYLVGEQFQDDKTYNVGKTLASALIINGITTYVGQAASWDRAPNGSWGTFPSGHTSSSFCIASVMDEAYGHLVGVPLYAAAALVGLERVDDRNHYFSDVMMGAVLGTVVGHAVASGRDPEFFGWKILPWAEPTGGTGVAFMKNLD